TKPPRAAGGRGGGGARGAGRAGGASGGGGGGRETGERAPRIRTPPFSIIGTRAGLRSLGLAVTLVGPYQATAAFVRRPWARDSGATLEAYIRSYVEGLRWVLAATNRDEAIALLAERLKLEPDVAALTYREAVDPAGGLTPDARLDREGLRNVLALRSHLDGQWVGRPPGPQRYYALVPDDRAPAATKRSPPPPRRLPP